MAQPVAAYSAVVYVSGVSTVDGPEACAFLSGAGASQVFQVTNTAKRVWDPAVAVVVKDNGTTLTLGTQYTFNYLFGTIQFVAYTPTTPVTVTGNYLPLAEAVLCSKFELNAKAQLIDTTNFDSGGAMQRTGGLVGFEGSLSGFDPLNTVLDGVAGTWQSWLLGQTPKVISFLPGTGFSYFRTWALIESEKTSAAVAGAIEGAVNWKSIVSLQNAGYGWGI